MSVNITFPETSSLSSLEAEMLLAKVRVETEKIEQRLKEIYERELFVEHLEDPSTFNFNYSALRKFDSYREMTSLTERKRNCLEKEIEETFKEGSSLLRIEALEDQKEIPSLRVPGYCAYVEKEYFSCMGISHLYYVRKYKRSTGYDTYSNYVEESEYEEDYILIDMILRLTKALDEIKDEDTFGDEKLFDVFFNWFVDTVEKDHFRAIVNVEQTGKVTVTTKYLSEIYVHTVDKKNYSNVGETLSSHFDTEESLSTLLYSFSLGDRSFDFLNRIGDYAHYYLGGHLNVFSNRRKSDFVTITYGTK
jgi:hypothetical protein